MMKCKRILRDGEHDVAKARDTVCSQIRRFSVAARWLEAERVENEVRERLPELVCFPDSDVHARCS
jgi:hypothetical protein